MVSGTIRDSYQTSNGKRGKQNELVGLMFKTAWFAIYAITAIPVNLYRGYSLKTQYELFKIARKIG